MNVLAVDVFGVPELIKAVNKTLSKIQADDLQPSSVRNSLSTCCPLVTWAGAAHYQPLAFGIGPAVPLFPSGWDQLFLSPVLEGNRVIALGGVLLALAMVPSVPGTCLGVLRIRAEAKVKQPPLFSVCSD